MKSFSKDLSTLRCPQPREVWIIEDSEIVMHVRNRKDKKRRPALIVSSSARTHPKATIINVIPLTTSREKDTTVFPVGKPAYVECVSNFKPSNRSCAVIELYQPIRRECFVERCGTIDGNCYEAIRNILCEKIIGHKEDEFDLNP